MQKIEITQFKKNKTLNIVHNINMSVALYQ